MSATRLLILGAVVDRGIAHGYQIRKDLESWRVDLWGNIGKGSVYHGLRQLSTEKLIEPAGSERGAGPARTRYVATPAGREAFRAMLEEALSSDSRDLAETMASVGFMNTLSRARVIELLEHRIERTRARRERVVSEYELHPEDDWAHHVEAIQLWAHSADSAIRWTEGLVARLKDGNYTMADEPTKANE